MIVFALVQTGCVTYQTKVSGAREAFKNEDPERAVELLEPLAKKQNDDQLVYLLDYATALQKAGRYQESADAYGDAAKIADIQDYHSVSRSAAALLLSEEMVQYKGDDYEKVLIHAMNSVNYLELGKLDEALVEVRQLNTMLHKFKVEAKKPYEQNAFAYYISAVIWEANRDYDDAYIAYKSVYDVAPNYAPLREDLVRSSLLAQRPEETLKWRAAFPEVKIKPEWSNKALGEVILVYEQGWGPRKYPQPENPRFPMLIPMTSITQTALMTIDDRAARSTSIFNVNDAAMKTMNDDYVRLVASRVVGIGVKAVVASQIGQRNKGLGAVAFLAMSLSDRADVRQWSTLPQTFQIARLTVKPGKYKVRLDGADWGNNPSREISEREVVVKPGRKAFISWRTVR